MKPNGIIYLAINKVNKKMYIGKTSVGLRKRMIQHKGDTNRLNSAFYKSIRKHGWENFEWCILDTCYGSDENLSQLEIYHIERLCSYYYGYNETIGGGGATGHKHTEESKIKMSQKSKGKLKSTEHKQALSAARVGIKKPIRSTDHCNNISKSKTGNKNPMFGKIKELCPSFGKVRNRETRLKNSKAHGGKPFVCRQNNKIYFMQVEASEELDVRPSAISRCLRGKTEHAKGFTFAYV